MDKHPLVSVISPCYNGEKFVFRFLDSILNQSYLNIQLILINDGSTDNTEKIVKSYEEKFKERGVEFIYFRQNNKGVSEAINTGLTFIKGKYLCWPDSDDYLEKDSILKRVEILESNLEYAAVTSDAYLRNVDDLEHSTGFLSRGRDNNYKENQFELLLEGSSIFAPCTHMVRTSVFKKVNPKLKIYPSRIGQNWQMLLPVYYQNKRYFLDTPLCSYIKYNSSLSQGDDSFDKKMHRHHEHEDVLLNTLNSMEMSSEDRTKYVDRVMLSYLKKRLGCAFEYRNISVFNKNVLLMKEKYQIDTTTKFYIYTIKFKPVYYIVKKVFPFLKNLRKISLKN